MNDTTPEVEEIFRARLLARSGVERVVMGSRMFDVARRIAIASFPPGLSELEIRARLCERFYGKEVDVQAFIKHITQQRTE